MSNYCGILELLQVGLTVQRTRIRRKIPGASEHRSIASPHGTAVHCRRPFFRSSTTLSRRIAHTPYGRQELVFFFPLGVSTQAISNVTAYAHNTPCSYYIGLVKARALYGMRVWDLQEC